MKFDLTFLSSFLSIVLIDLVLSGDNAVVIAMAVRSLPKRQRVLGITFGAGAAVVLRIVLTFFAAKLLSIPYLKAIGGLLIGWIAVKLFLESAPDEKVREASSLMHAIRMICVADFIMSTDNVLGVAGASKGNLFLLLFGLGLSIPIVVGTSTLISMLMDKFPAIVYIGAAVLGKVAGEMVMTDPIVVRTFHPAVWMEYAVQAVCAIGVIVTGKLLLRRSGQRVRALETATGNVGDETS